MLGLALLSLALVQDVVPQPPEPEPTVEAAQAAPGVTPSQPPGPAPTVEAADASGNRIEAFPESSPAPERGADGVVHGTARHCAGRNWCVWAEDARGPWEFYVWHNPQPDAPADPIPRRLAIEPDDEGREYAIWPWIVREPSGAVIVGLLESSSAMYSGGSANLTHLRLYRAEPESADVDEVIDLPLAGSAMIRACFSEADLQARREACHDEYDLSGVLRLDPATEEGPPVFTLETRAATFPGRVTRSQDSRDRGPLGEGDLVWVPDPDCSFTRRIAWDVLGGRYTPTERLPECSDFLGL